METGNKGVWILIAAVVVIACCCLVVAGAAAAGWFVTWPSGWRVSTISQGKAIDQTFEVSESPQLKIENFAGSVSVRAGRAGEIRVAAVKHASRAADVDRIKVELTEREGGLLVKTTKPAGLTNASVELEITTAADTRLDLQTGAGSAEVSGLNGGVRVDTGAGSVVASDLSGDVEVHSGAGSVNLRNVNGQLKVDTGSGQVRVEGLDGEIQAESGTGAMVVSKAAGPVRLGTGSGSIDYQGSPQGECRFETGSGSISLRLPADLNAQVDLHTGSGSIDSRFPVAGRSTRSDVEGIIGSGQEATIYAETGSGSIDLISE